MPCFQTCELLAWLVNSSQEVYSALQGLTWPKRQSKLFGGAFRATMVGVEGHYVRAFCGWNRRQENERWLPCAKPSLADLARTL